MTTNANIIDTYTARQALEDGIWIDPAVQTGEDLAGHLGFPIPIFVTCGVWADLVAVPACAPWQDVTGRLWDLLWMLRCAVLKPGNAEETLITVELLATHREAMEPNPTLHRVWAEVVQDPELGAAIVLMWPRER